MRGHIVQMAALQCLSQILHRRPVFHNAVFKYWQSIHQSDPHSKGAVNVSLHAIRSGHLNLHQLSSLLGFLWLL